MSPDEYLDSITPMAKRSALAPLATDLRYLRDKGCSIRQLRDYAQSKGIEVHLATVARQLLAPRLGNCPIFFVESINEAGTAAKVRGRELHSKTCPRPRASRMVTGSKSMCSSRPAHPCGRPRG